MLIIDLLKSNDEIFENYIEKSFPGLYDVYKTGFKRDLPQRQTKYSAAYDLALPYSELIKAHSTCYLNFGFYLSKDPYTTAYILPRSSLAKKKGLILLSSPILSESNLGIQVLVQNISDEDVVISAGERIFQLLLIDSKDTKTYFNNFERVSTYNFNFPKLSNLNDSKDLEIEKFYFQSLYDVEIQPNSLSMLKTGIKSKFNSSEVLLIFNGIYPNESNIVLANTIGVVDADYYNNESNEGEIGFIYYNRGYLPYRVRKGDILGYGVIKTYAKIEGDIINGERTGGYGST